MLSGYLQFILKPVRSNIFNTRSLHLQQAVREAEKVVGYTTSFLNLRWLLTDEISNLALHIHKLFGTHHPLLQTARELVVGNGLPNWGLIVLLISKAAGLNYIKNELDKDRTAGILNSQRVIAEVTEMLKTSHIVHKSVVNLDRTNVTSDLNFGNKLSLLSGDFLLSRSYKELAHIYNHDVSLLMSSTLRDLTESEFIGKKPYKPVNFQCINVKSVSSSNLLDYKFALGNPRAEWIYRSLLGGANLLAKACSSSLMLSEQPPSVQQLGYVFGSSVALACQIKLERESFMSDTQDSVFSLVSAPVMFHLEEDPDLFDLIESENIDHNELRKCILHGNSLSTTKELQGEFCTCALKVLEKFPNSDARTALENIIKTIN